MPRFGITGHMDLPPDVAALVTSALRESLEPHAGPDLIGVSCLAVGADQLFAAVILDLGGNLEVVLPSQDYRERKVRPNNLETFDLLLGRAAKVQYMAFSKASREAYDAANNAVLTSCDCLYAVWDGQPPGGQGAGTADTVLEARRRGLPVEVIWPTGAYRR